tara:strand:- start:134 stop:313 length:180 start_codon:yes stop_codon:yes gene_type:complete
MKYLDLLTELQNLTEEQLLQDVVVYNKCPKTYKGYHAASNIFLANETDPIALNQPFLTV